MISKMALTLIKKYIKLIIAMILVSSLGIALMVGLGSGYHSLDISLNEYFTKYHYTDLIITTDALIPKDDTKKLENLFEIQKVTPRLVADGHMRLENGRMVSVRSFSYNDDNFQQLYTYASQESDTLPDIMVEKVFAEHNGLQPGDHVTIQIDNQDKEVNVGAIVTCPECMAVVQDPFAIADATDFGYIYYMDSELKSTAVENTCNQLLINVEEWSDAQAAYDAVKDTLSKYGIGIANYTLYENTPVYRLIEDNMVPLHIMSYILPTIFFICMIIVIILFMSQMIRQSRKDIGVLRALGAQQKQIVAIFIIIALIIGLISSILGTGLGIYLMKITADFFIDYFNMPQRSYHIDMGRFLLATGMTIISALFATWISTRSISKIEPSEAMTREKPTTFKAPKFIERIASLFSPSIKFGIMSLFRNTRRFIFSCICISASVMLILTALAFNVSKNAVLEDFFDNRIQYDAQICFDQDPDPSVLSALLSVDNVKDVETMDCLKTEIANGDNKETIVINAFTPQTDKVNVYNEDGEKIEIPENGIILESHIAKNLGLKAGDTITICDQPITIADISFQSMNRICYLSLNQLHALSEPDCVMVLVNGGEESAILELVNNISGYRYTNFTQVARNTYEQIFETFSIAVIILIIFALLMGIVIVFNTMQTNIMEQQKELAILRTLGFQVNDISEIWSIQTFAQYFVSCLIGLPLGTFVATMALQQMQGKTREYPFIHEPWQYLITAFLVLIYILITHVIFMKRIKKWDLAECTKDRE